MESLISPLAKFLRKRKRAAQQLLESSMCDDGAPVCDLEDHAVLLATCTRPYEFHQPFYAKPRPDPKPFWALIKPHWTDEDFIKAVRVDREVFTSLVDQLVPLLEKAKTNWKPHPITVEEQVYIALLFLANGSNYSSIAREVGWSQTTVQRAVEDVTDAIVSKLGPVEIRFPSGQQLHEQAVKFALKGQWDARGVQHSTPGIPQIVAALDGKHVMVPKPPNSGDDYKDRFKTYSVLMQCTCDADYCFTDVHVGYSGRAHDVRHFEDSPLYKMLQPGGSLAAALLAGARVVQGVSMPYMIVCDSAYPATVFTLPALRVVDALTRERRCFNMKHSQTRNIIERAFGVLVQRWRCLLKQLDVGILNVPKVVAAACVLHNICQRNGIPLPDVDEAFQRMLQDYQAAFGEGGSAQVADPSMENTEAGEAIREAVISYVNGR